MNRLCVFCGSSMGGKSIYAEAAQQMGQLLVERNITLVYGGGNVGLMGTIATAVMESGGKAVGVLPQALVRKESGHLDLTELYIVNSMHERKMMMATLSDGFVAMPGGFGTMEEIMEVITWSQLGFHDKPTAFLNVDGYYDKLLEFVEYMIGQGFIRDHLRQLVLSADTPEAMLDVLDAYEPMNLHKWVEREDL